MLDSRWIKKLKDNNTIIIGTATTLAEAKLLEKHHVDLIVAQGSEAGGHRGTFLAAVDDSLIPTQELVPQLVDNIKLPIIASGGIMDGSAIAAQLKSGASGVQMGTAFLGCPETGINPKYKKLLLSASSDSTTLTRGFSGKFARGVNNRFIKNMQHAKILEYPIQNALTQTMRTAAKQQGNTDYMSLWAGQSLHMIRQSPAAELMQQFIAETEAALS